MWINSANARLAVDDRRGLRLNAARGTLLRSVRGTLWITIDNDPRDIVLDPGESFVVDTDEPLFAMALGGRATLDHAAAPIVARRAVEAPRSRPRCAGGAARLRGVIGATAARSQFSRARS
jgi:hypothetical protein